MFAKFVHGRVIEEHHKFEVYQDMAKCFGCSNISIWINKKMIYPLVGNVEMVNQDLPKDIQDDYNEAKNIVSLSPRGAAALLRLAIQKLCVHLGEKGNNLNNDIANLVKRGLPKKIQQAFDIVRVVGNNAVHPGVIDLKDNVQIANTLFSLINVIAEVMISQPKKIDENYNEIIPKEIKDGIEKRDKK